MSGLLFLTSDDFSISEGTNGKILCNSIPGFSLILFYSTQCRYCETLIPIFKKLPGTIGGCQFGMINISSNKKCVQMSKNTISPIAYVPCIILHIDGKPFMKYNGPQDGKEIRRFIIEVANKVQNKQTFSKETVKHEKKGIPEYTIGVPLCGPKDKQVCYLEMDTAYVKS